MLHKPPGNTANEGRHRSLVPTRISASSGTPSQCAHDPVNHHQEAENSGHTQPLKTAPPGEAPTREAVETSQKHTCSSRSHAIRAARLQYHRRKILDGDKIDVDKFGSPTSSQIFPSMLRMLCANMCASGGVFCVLHAV